MRTVVFALGVLFVVTQAACGASDNASNDASVSPDANANDAGDAGTPAMLEVSFEPAVAPPGLPRGVLTRGEGNELFAVYNGVVEYSTDRGNTWEARAAASALSMSFHDGTLFASDGAHLWRSTNKALVRSACARSSPRRVKRGRPDP